MVVVFEETGGCPGDDEAWLLTVPVQVDVNWLLLDNLAQERGDLFDMAFVIVFLNAEFVLINIKIVVCVFNRVCHVGLFNCCFNQ